MALLTILEAPDPRLKVKAEPVETVTDEIRTLLDDMLETMYEAHGVGLAAPQVAVAKRVLVMDCAGKDEDPQPIKLVNPEVIWESDEEICQEEGCLSLPEQYSDVTRPERVKVRFLDETGTERVVEADGLLARCVQHEMDHLEGVLFVDHISALKRKMILRRLQKAKKFKKASGE